MDYRHAVWSHILHYSDIPDDNISESHTYLTIPYLSSKMYIIYEPFPAYDLNISQALLTTRIPGTYKGMLPWNENAIYINIRVQPAS